MSWFETWFDSPFYHILYKNRDDSEAQFFIDNLINYLKPKSNDKFLDLACGKGRHSIYLNSKGLDTQGCDLSPQSILYAKQFENESLSFFEHDMRNKIVHQKFDFVLNLFTSFGYFEDKSDNLKTLISVENALTENGVLVIDFFNASNIIENLISNEIKIIDDIKFEINRKVENGYIIKNITFNANKKDYHFTEKVQVINLHDFENLLKKVDLEIIRIFGSYQLDTFDIKNSKRLIIIAQKK